MVQRQQNTATESSGMYGTFLLVVEIIIVQLKFWYTFFESIIRTFIPAEEINVKNEVVLVTGSGHGMGRETSLQYGALGAKVICWDINEKNNQQTVKDIKAAGGQAFGYTCNIMNRTDVIELANKVKSEHGFVSIVVNNAGIMPCHPILQQTETEITNMFGVNVLAHFWIIQAFLPEMVKRNQGHFVALSSCAGLFGLPNLVPYCGTKFAVRGYMASLAEELRLMNPQNKIKLTTIYPYIVDTGLCKKPRYRFSSLMDMVSPKDAAASIINAQRTGLEEASIPRSYLYMERFGRALPRESMRILNRFVDTYIESDL